MASQPLFQEGAFKDYKPDPRNGKLIYHASGCANCHAAEGNDKLLSGGRKIETKFGDVYVPNISSHPKNGIGNWSNSQFLNAVMRGVSPKGEQYLGAVFPFASYSRMKPEDALDLRAYIATLPVSGMKSKAHELNFLSKAIVSTWTMMREPLKKPSNPQLARGQYLVEALGHCAECHTPRKSNFGLSYELDETRSFEGETGIMGDFAPKITGKRLKAKGVKAFAIGSLSEAKRLNGKDMTKVAMRRFSHQLSYLPIEDRVAIYAYLTNEPTDVAGLEDKGKKTKGIEIEAAPAQDQVAVNNQAQPAANPATDAAVVIANDQPAVSQQQAPVQQAAPAQPQPQVAQVQPQPQPQQQAQPPAVVTPPVAAPVQTQPPVQQQSVVQQPPVQQVAIASQPKAAAPVSNYVDNTGADELMQRINNYCSVQEEVAPAAYQQAPEIITQAPMQQQVQPQVVAPVPQVAAPVQQQPQVVQPQVVTPAPVVQQQPVAVAPQQAQPAPVQAVVQQPVVNNRLAQLQQKADLLMDKYCRECHGSGARDEPQFPMGDVEDIISDPDKVVKGKPNQSPLYTSITEGDMPRRMKMSSEEIKVLEDWIIALGETDVAQSRSLSRSFVPSVTSAKPAVITRSVKANAELPRYIGGSLQERMVAAVSDINQINEADRPFVRYFSFAHVPLAKVDCSAPVEKRNPVRYLHAALNKFINSVSRAPRLKTVTPVKGTNGALVRIDIRDYNWTANDWNGISSALYTQGAKDAGYSEKVWKKKATRYPYALDPKSHPMLQVLSAGTGTQVPVMRAEWFTRFVSQAPYYDMMLRLPAKIADLEKRMGVDVNANILQQRVVRSAFTNSGVSDNNRMLERHDLPFGGYYWKSYDFAGRSGDQSLTLHPDGPADIKKLLSGTQPFKHDGGEMIFSMANGMQGYYLSLSNGNRIEVGPASIVSFRRKQLGKGVEIVNARSCFDCHANGIISKRDQMHDIIKSSSRYSRKQLDVLLRYYPQQSVIKSSYDNDRQYFLKALAQIGATELNAAGKMVSMKAPKEAGEGEIVTYLADFYFDSLDLDAVAREFDLSTDELLSRVNQVGDANLQQTVSDWTTRLKQGIKLHRSELEKAYVALMPRITDYRARGDKVVKAVKVVNNTYLQKASNQAYTQLVQKSQKPFKPQTTNLPKFTPPLKPSSKLKLKLTVPKTKWHVGELLAFDVSASRRCELQVLYVEESKNIQELPQKILGAKFLEPGEVRRIPAAGSGLRIRFNTPGQGETMVAYCRENGLGSKRITAKEALKFAKENFQPLSRGIIIEAAAKEAEDKGQSASNAVTFNVFK